MEVEKEEPIKDMVNRAMKDDNFGRRAIFPNLIIVGIIGLVIIVASLVIFLNPHLLGSSSPATVVLILGILLGVTDIIFAAYVYVRLQKTAKEVDVMLRDKFATPDTKIAELNLEAEFLQRGRPWTEADEEGNVVQRNQPKGSSE